MGLKNFSGYLNEGINVKELPMFFSQKLTKLLNSVDSKVSKDLLDLTKSGNKYPISYIDITDNIDFLTVFPSDRIGRVDGITEQDVTNPTKDSPVWTSRLRNPQRIGALVAKLIPKYAGSKDLENFVHLVKGKLDASNYEIKIVRGEDIRKWYHFKTYYNPNPGIVDKPEEEGVLDVRTPLMKSCLKQPEKQPFFDIYCDNPDKVGMLIMLNDEKKLVARSIIWFECYVSDNAENPSKGVLMDRIYYTQESDVNIFIDYAKEHGWFYKPSQAKEITSFVMKGEVCDKTITTRLTHHGVFDRYPYLDTMCFYTPDTGRLSTSRGKPAINPNTKEIMERFQLQRTNGGTKRLSTTK